ncbi:MAG: CHASE2 domain-containing protein [Nitrospirae bacterium]|nr:CHASE2 domain-containing protein [Nitrospirota bacterium]
MKSKTAKTIPAKIPDWAIAGAVAFFVMLAFVFEWYPFQKLEYLTYDLRSVLRQKKLSTPVVIVGTDETKPGQSPLPAAYAADMVRKLKGYEARTIGVGVIYSETENSENKEGLAAVRGIREKIDKDPAALKDAHVIEIRKALIEAERSLNSGAAFAEALGTAKNVILPLSFNLKDNAAEDSPLADYMLRNSVKADPKGAIPAARSFVAPLKHEFAEKAAALGHLNIEPDSDGVSRGEPLFIQYKDRLFPSFAFQLALGYLGYGINEITINGGIAAVRTLAIPIDEKAKMLISFSGKTAGAPYYPLNDVMGDKVPAAVFKDKIVLIGLPAAAGGATEITAAAIENIVNANHIRRPWWAAYVELLVMALFGGIIAFVVPRMRAVPGAAVTAGILIVWGVICIFLFYSQGIWIKVSYPIVLLFLGHIAVMSGRYIAGEEMPGTLDANETNKMLGLSLHGQGQLDAAFEKFRKCRLEDYEIKELLYNLGQDFEEHGMPNKAREVYEHILSAGDYLGLAEKVKKLRGQTEKAVSVDQHEEATVIMESADTSNTLGRYEVLRELGRGAMGIVFLGRDPKINRDVAIKTLRYEDIDSEQVDEVKTRFFREAEAAGRLSHPNIVRVYDVGEDKDTAYMAMELLDGTDLIRYCAKDARLPFGEVLRVVTRVGEALDYAHLNGVVHRDIKPANIMLLKNKELRVTDFGIARVMESSKTQTGMVLGTPSYMSPEQIAGRKVDGRSDLFSLGVVFFELLTGERPFKGDTIATLMYNITSTPPTSIKKIEPRIPVCIVEIIDKLLQKNADSRYLRGKDLLDAINKCKKTLIKRPAAPEPPVK